MPKDLLDSTPLSSGVSFPTREELHIEALGKTKTYQARLSILEKIGFYHHSGYLDDDYILFTPLDIFVNKDATKYILINSQGGIYRHEGVYAFDDIGILVNIEGEDEDKVVYGFYSKINNRYNIHVFGVSPDDELESSAVKNGFTKDGSFESKQDMKKAFGFYLTDYVSSDIYDIINDKFY